MKQARLSAIIISIVGVLSVGSASLAGAATSSVPGTASINGGTLSISPQNEAGLSFSGQLNGNDLVLPNGEASGDSFTVNDATGTADGWNVTAITQGPFTGVSGPAAAVPSTLSSNALTFNGDEASSTSTSAPTLACSLGSTCTLANNPLVSYPINVPASVDGPVILNAGVDTGMGSEVASNLGWWLSIPSNTLAGVYRTTVELDVNSGPYGLPTNTVSPSIGGTFAVGDTLTANVGSWSDPTFTYQWYSCATASPCSNVVGTNSTYTIQQSDAGSYIELVVTGTNGAGSSAAKASNSAMVESVPSNESAPAISGDMLVGNTLTTTPGTWYGGGAQVFSYQWYDCSNSNGTGCSPISGATSSTYTLADSDYNDYLTVAVTATNDAGTSSPVDSLPTGPTPGVSASFSGSPSIVGTAQVGNTLNAAVSTSGYPTPTMTYQWTYSTTSAGPYSNISGATSSSYNVDSAYVGDYIGLNVTATDSAGSATQSASPTSQVVGPAISTSAPTISGSVAIGNSLTVSNGSWRGNPASYTYQWYDCTSSSGTPGGGCSPISGATSASYTLADSDYNDYLLAKVTAVNFYGSVSANSTTTAIVPGVAPTFTNAPAISGTAVVGNTLSGTASASAYPAPTLSYQWEYATSSSGAYTAIGGATSTVYLIPTTYVGDYLEFVTIATNAFGSTTLSSSPTSQVIATPVNTSAPTFSSASSTTFGGYNFTYAGAQLTASPGSWTGSGLTYSYQWQQQLDDSSTWSNISGATSSTYTPTSIQLGGDIRVVVTASNSTSATSSPDAVTASSFTDTSGPNGNGTLFSADADDGWNNAALISPNGAYALLIQGDGNFVLYSNSFGVAWSGGPDTLSSGEFELTSSGSLLLLNPNGTTYSTVEATGVPGAILNVTNSGTVTLTNPVGGAVLWTS